MRIHLVTVVGSPATALLQPMLEHYSALGIESLLINVRLEGYGHPSCDEIAAIAHNARAEIVSIYIGKWLPGVNSFLYRQTQRLAPDDWCVVADADECQISPRELRALLREMDEGGYDYVQRSLIDRVTRDGCFAELLSGQSSGLRFH